jgi:hypothetical protein
LPKRQVNSFCFKLVSHLAQAEDAGQCVCRFARIGDVRWECRSPECLMKVGETRCMVRV